MLVSTTPDVVGLAAITARLRVGSRNTVRLYTLLPRDPLTLHRFLRKVWQRGQHLDEWRIRHVDGPAAKLPRLTGLRQIGEFVGRGVTPAQLLGWSKRERDPLPLFTVSGDVVAFESALRDWCFRHDAVQRFPVAAAAEGRIGRRLVERAKSARNQATSCAVE